MGFVAESVITEIILIGKLHLVLDDLLSPHILAGENILPNVRMQHPGTITVSQGRIILGAKLHG